MPKPYLTALATLACATPFAARAATDAGDSALQEITVQTNSLESELPQELARAGTRVDVISGDAVRNSTAVDVATALQKLAPGLYLQPKNGPFDYVDASLQGSRTGDILWLVDGVRINNRLYNGTTPLDTLPAAIIDHIEIIEGGQALFYGTQAAAGAINIVTKGISKTLSADFALSADTNNAQHADGFISDTLGGHQLAAYISGDHSSGFRPFRDQDVQPSGTLDRGYVFTTFGLKYAYEFSDDLRLGVNWQHTGGRADDASPFLVAEAYNNRTEDLVTGKLDATLGDHVQLSVKPYYHSWRSHYTEYDNTIPVGGPLETEDNHDPWGYRDYGTNVLAKLQFDPRLEYFVGYDLQRYTGSDAVLVITQHTENTNAVFGQVRTTAALVPGLVLAAGVRYSDPSVGESATVWNASGRYELGAGFFLRGQAGTAFRLPTAEELFANDPEDERGNPNLKPETSHNANLSLGQRWRPGGLDLTWEVIGFYRNITNLIDYDTFDDTTGQSVFGNVPGTVRVRGGEFSLDAAANDSVSGHLDFTYNHVRDSSGEAVARIPGNLLKLQLDLHPPGLPFGATATLTRVGTTLRTGLWDGTESYGNDFVLDLDGRWFIDSQRRHRIDLAIDNLANRAYAGSLGNGERDADGSSYTYWNRGLPRTFRIGYSYHFQ